MADTPRKLSLEEAIQTALASDADLYIAREESLVAAEGVALARGAFATRIFGELFARRDEHPPSAVAFGAVDRIAGATLGVAGGLPLTGLTYEVTGGLVRQDRDDPFGVYSAGNTAVVHAELVQPLRRGAFGAARRPITVASLRRDRSALELRARVESTVGAVQVAYWNLVRARGEREARVSAVELAKEQVEETRRLKRLGAGTDLDNIEAEAGVSRREQELLRTEQDVVEADGRLFEALGVRTGEGGWVANSPIVPTDAVKIEPLVVEVDAQIAVARARRAEVRAAHALTAAESAELEVTDNARRMAIDLVAAAGSVGFAGTFATTPATMGVVPDPAYDGRLSGSFANIGRDVSVYLGLRFELPLGTHVADARHSIQLRTASRARLVERQVTASIESEVRTAVARVALDARLVEAADRAVELSNKLLDGTRKRFRSTCCAMKSSRSRAARRYSSRSSPTIVMNAYSGSVGSTRVVCANRRSRVMSIGELSCEIARRGTPSHSPVFFGPRESNHSAVSSQSQNRSASW
ncbi:MAG: TolC family protein [Kofleriaceae bacterium]